MPAQFDRECSRQLRLLFCNVEFNTIVVYLQILEFLALLVKLME